MNIKLSKTEDFEIVKNITVQTIKDIYPHYYPKGAVEFFLEHHNADKLSSEEISRDEYDNWRYHYPKFDTTQLWAKVSSQELSDALATAFQDKLTTDD